MQNKKAYKAQNIQLLYNIVHLLINIVLFYELSVASWFNDYSYRCQPIDTANTGIPLRVIIIKSTLLDDIGLIIICLNCR